MKIDREQLVELLVQRTGLQQEDVEEQLAELIKRIRTAASEGKSYEIERFGTFSMEDEELYFEPADELETEVNNKYAGMEPIELIGAYKESEKTEEPVPREPEVGDKEESTPDEETVPEKEPEQEKVEPEEKEIWGFDEEAAAAGEEPPEAKPDEQQEPTDEETVVEEAESGRPQEEKEEPEPEEAEPTVESKEEDQEPEPEKIDKEEPASQSEEPVADKLKPDKNLKGKYSRKATKETSSISGVMIAASVIIILAAAAWVLLNMGVFESTGTGRAETSNQQQSVVTPQPGGPADQQVDNSGAAPSQSGWNESEQVGKEDQTASQDGSEAASEPETGNEVAGNKGQQANASPYGLKGERDPGIGGGYTIVLHSLRDEEKAQQIREGLDQEGYRTIMMSATVNGYEYWRVGVGQFETIADAEQTANELPEPYRNNFFIKRIR